VEGFHRVRLNNVSNPDVAPTIAAILGVEMKAAKGHPIQTLLDQAKHQ
jgi:hypothetical protein